MLNLIATHIGGKVKIVDNNKFIIWVVNNKREIFNIIKIFENYPPLTSRLKAQLAFLLECYAKNDIQWYLITRDKKYENFNFINKMSDLSLDINYSYFNEWLSGFIEAEGCFSIKKSYRSFSIGQNNDHYIILMIKNHFNIKNEIRFIKNKFWFIEVYRKTILIKIIDHCTKYPLLGEKTLSFYQFKNFFK